MLRNWLFMCSFAVHGAWKYIRGCGVLGEVGVKGDERFCLMRTGTYNIFMEYCTCNSRDGCNSSDTWRISNFLFGAVIALPLLRILVFRS